MEVVQEWGGGVPWSTGGDQKVQHDHIWSVGGGLRHVPVFSVQWNQLSLETVESGGLM